MRSEVEHFSVKIQLKVSERLKHFKRLEYLGIHLHNDTLLEFLLYRFGLNYPKLFNIHKIYLYTVK